MTPCSYRFPPTNVPRASTRPFGTCGFLPVLGGVKLPFGAESRSGSDSRLPRTLLRSATGPELPKEAERRVVGFRRNAGRAHRNGWSASSEYALGRCPSCSSLTPTAAPSTLRVVARLRDGIRLDQARSEMQAVAARLREANSGEDAPRQLGRL